MSDTRDVPRERAWIVLAALATVVLLNVGTLGSDPWSFRPGIVRPHGLFAFVVRMAHERWDVGLLRSVAMLAGCGIVVLALATLTVRRWRAWVLIVASFACAVALIAPAVALQVGLRQSTHPWFFVNDSTFVILADPALTNKADLTVEGTLSRDTSSSTSFKLPSSAISISLRFPFMSISASYTLLPFSTSVEKPFTTAPRD